MSYVVRVLFRYVCTVLALGLVQSTSSIYCTISPGSYGPVCNCTRHCFHTREPVVTNCRQYSASCHDWFNANDTPSYRHPALKKCSQQCQCNSFQLCMCYCDCCVSHSYHSITGCCSCTTECHAVPPVPPTMSPMTRAHSSSLTNEPASVTSSIHVVGLAVGVSIAGVVLLALIIAAIIFLYRRRSMRQVASETKPSPHLGTTPAVVPSAPASEAGNIYITVDQSPPGGVQQPAVTSSNDAETDDDVTDTTVIDNDLYEREGQGQGQQNTSADYECTLVDNDLYR